MIEGIIFDLYGTLVRLGRDAKPYLPFARAVRPDDPASVLRASIVTDAPDLGALSSILGVEPPDELAAMEAELTRDVEAVELFDDAAESLASLRGMGLKLGLISNLASPYKAPFHRLGLGGFFDAALFSCDVGRRKPDPALYLEMATALGLAPGLLIMVGDKRPNDFDGPKGVGMGAILLQGCGGASGPSSIGSLRELPRRLHEGRA